jgi:hypothetical protein
MQDKPHLTQPLNADNHPGQVQDTLVEPVTLGQHFPFLRLIFLWPGTPRMPHSPRHAYQPPELEKPSNSSLLFGFQLFQTNYYQPN